MATAVAARASVETVASSQQAWNEFVLGKGGHLLQSWNWGAFKARHGWCVERVAVANEMGSAGAQILFRRGGPFSIAYIPRGPAISGNVSRLAESLFERIDEVCQSKRTLHVIVEPNDYSLVNAELDGYLRGPEHFQPARTVKVPLLQDDELLAQMQQKTRYSVRLAMRRHVQIERALPSTENVDRFFQLLQETSARNEFGIHSREYYADFLEVFGSDALLLFARVDDQIAAGLVAARFGSEAIYMYGASSSEHRANGAAFLLQFESMKWARDLGCTHYDLWGIPEDDPEHLPNPDGKASATKGEDLRGLYRFKTGFGGEIVTYPSTLERRYRPILSYIARRRYGNRV